MKLRKLGYSSGQTVRLGRVPANSDYPRWGYPDRLEHNLVMPKALCAAAAMFLGVTESWQGWKALQTWRFDKQVQNLAQGPRRPVKVLTAAELGVPPSLTRPQAATIRVRTQRRPHLAMPKPVPDEEAYEKTIATVEEVALYDEVASLSPGDSLVIDASDMKLPAPDEYIAFEKPPLLVTMETPTYSHLAREAAVEGNVLLRVLVGADGFVKDVRVVQSVPLLDEAAVDAGWTAVFKPAVQKDRPIAAWMNIPIAFKLKSI